MDHWGVKSYENDGAHDAIDAGFERAHGERYEALMDDRNPMTFEQVQRELADARTLEESINALWDDIGREVPPEDWDDLERLALAGIVTRHAELNVAVPEEWITRAIEWLEHEEVDWPEATTRRLRLEKEIELLRRASTTAAPGQGAPPGD